MDAGEVNVGDKVLADVFSVDDYVDVTGVSKGRGFAGVQKRHHFGGGGGSHGSMFHRAPGSIGASAWPSRVLKGMKAAGHMGNARVTVRNLRVVQVLAEENTLLVEGAVPGPQGSYVVVHEAKAPHK
jgi:large subunit ribosomal protein L3